MWSDPRSASRRALAASGLAIALAGCGDNGQTGVAGNADQGSAAQILITNGAGADAEALARNPSGGQLAPTVNQGAKVTRYAAARFLEQASFGPTPASIERVRSLGFETWIDEQLARAPSQIEKLPAHSAGLLQGIDNAQYFTFRRQRWFDQAVSGADQLRQRVSLALSQFIVVSDSKAQAYAALEYHNLLQRLAFSNYADLLREVTRHPAMGQFLDNAENRPADACDNCAPNENYARELMQLFTLGVYRLQPDGTIVRDSAGRPIQTYSQDDVEHLARALTGWEYAWKPGLPDWNWGNFGEAMRPATWAAAHDDGAKLLLGQSIPAGQGAARDLESAIAILMAHPNIGPFVSLRIIQHLVASDPSPAYIRRVAAVFEDDGEGVRGNLAAVVKAVLLDAEARRGDTPGAIEAGGGKIREPVLWNLGLMRGLGCRSWPTAPDGSLPWRQIPYGAPSVFSFYLPTDRAPGSLLLAPEQRLLHSGELADRLGRFGWLVHEGAQKLSAAGCSFQPFVDAYQRSPRAFLDLVAERYLRGSMPATLRAQSERLIGDMNWGTPEQRASTLLQFVLVSPSYGVIR